MLVAQHFCLCILLLLETAGRGNKVLTHVTALSLLLPVLQVKNISYFVCTELAGLCVCQCIPAAVIRRGPI